MGDDSNPGKRTEMFGAYYFAVDIDKERFPFQSCSGLQSESAVVELQEGGFNGTTRKLIGPTKFPNIVLKQGLCGATSKLWQLRNSSSTTAKPRPRRKGRQTPNRFSGTITQMGPKARPPSGSSPAAGFASGRPEFDATKNDISVETIEIAHEGLMMLPGAEGGSSDGDGG